MSRIGFAPIALPQGVEVAAAERNIRVKGPRGELSVPLHGEYLGVELEDGMLRVSRSSEEKKARALHGLTRALLANAVAGVTGGFSKTLEVYGVGYRAEVQGRKLTLHLGYSHPVVYEAPEGIELETANPVQGAQGRIVVKGIDKQQVGQVAADIRARRKPDPYKGKGIRYEGEVIHLKAGKTAVV